MLREAFGRWQIRRVRRAYTSVGGPTSDEPGYAGLIDEMRAGWKTLDEPARNTADDRVLEAIFFGQLGVASLRLAGRIAPRTTSAVLAAGAPVVLTWLVGELRLDAPRRNTIPQCRFRAEGGPDLCEHVCRRPTQRFCRDAGFPVTLTPDPASLGCGWSWGP